MSKNGSNKFFNKFKKLNTRISYKHRAYFLRKNYFFYALILAIVFHLTLGITLWNMPQKVSLKKNNAARVIFKEKDTLKEKQLVKIDKPKKQRVPKKADFKASYNQKVKKQTKAKQNPYLKGKVSNKSLKNNEKKFPQPHGKGLTLDDFKKEKKVKDDPLGLKLAVLEAAKDYLPNIEEGSETKLNTWQWKHAPFFNRLKGKIAKIWSPQVQIRQYDPKGQLLGNKDRVTVLSATIDSQGNLKTLRVLSDSGVAYLDQEAKRSIKKAQPFPFPPKELFMKKDSFTFQFAFHLQVNKGAFFNINI